MAAATSHKLLLTFPDPSSNVDAAAGDTVAGTIRLVKANGQRVRPDRDVVAGPNGGNIPLEADGVVHTWTATGVNLDHTIGGQIVGGYVTPYLWANTGDTSAPADHIYVNGTDGTYYEIDVVYTQADGTVRLVTGSFQIDADTDYQGASQTVTVDSVECVLSSALSVDTATGTTSAGLVSLISATIATLGTQTITSGDGAPSSTPGSVGDIHIDVTNDIAYVATGTASSADWDQATGAGGGGGLSNIVEDLTPQLGGDLDLNGNVVTGLEIGTDVQAHSAVLDATTASFTTADETKLDAIESGATADQTGAEIKAAYEAELDTNAFTDAEQTKLAGIEAAADVTDATNVAAAGAHMSGGTDVPVADGGTGASTAAGARTNLGLVIGTDVQAHSAVLDATTASFTAADESKLDAIEAGATADQTGAEIKAAYEAEADTNAFTDAEQSKLAGIEAGADVTDATNVAAAGAPIITTGAGAPSSTPSAEGDVYVDTTNDNVWVAAGTASSADWKQATGAGGGDLLAANNLSDLANAATARTNLGVAIGTDVQAHSAVLDATTASFTSADETKLDGIEAGADVTDTANVTAAGALMDSEVDADLKTLSLPANTTITAFGASLVDDADAATARTTLGLVIGTNVQAQDAELSALAGLTSAADKLPYFTGSGTAALTGLTSAARDELAAMATAQTVTGTTDTLAAADARRLTIYSNAAAVTVTVPTGTFSAGDWFLLQSSGAGGLSISTAGITLNGSAPNTAVAQNEGLYIEFTAANTITVLGGTA